uniref:Uncharacterized protein n=1 Tax=Mola mola TaxID=94237 RepID=A0A3Q4AA01_MOLML
FQALKSSAAFHEQTRSLERAMTEDYLKRKIRSCPELSELIRMHILEGTTAKPSLQAKQLQLKRARLADDLNDKISHWPGPMELVQKNILPVHSSIKQANIGNIKKTQFKVMFTSKQFKKLCPILLLFKFQIFIRRILLCKMRLNADCTHCK